MNTVPSPRHPKLAHIDGIFGTKINKLTYISEAPRRSMIDRHRRVVVVCDCGKTEPFATRLYDVQRGHVTSCGCHRAKRFNDYQDGKAAQLEPAVCRSLFRDSAKSGRNDWLVAAKNKVNKHLVRAGVRLHKSRLLAKFGEVFRAQSRPVFGPHEARPSLLKRRWLRKAVKFICPITAPMIVEWHDLDEQLQNALAHWSGASSLQLAAA